MIQTGKCTHRAVRFAGMSIPPAETNAGASTFHGLIQVDLL